MSTALPVSKGDRYFEPGVWFSLPMRLRRRWWDETNYGAKDPSKELMDEINAELKRANPIDGHVGVR